MAPGEVLKITGSNFGPATAVLGDASSGAYDTTLAGVRVWFDSTPAPLLSVSATEIVAVVPFELDGQQATQFQVESNGQKSAAVPLAVVPAAPAIYTIDGSGQGQGQATDEDGSPNSKDNPAANGSLVTFSATGGGQTNPASVTGAVVSDNTPQLNQTSGADRRRGLRSRDSQPRAGPDQRHAAGNRPRAGGRRGNDARGFPGRRSGQPDRVTSR